MGALVDALVGFAEVLTALAVTDNDVLRARFDQHIRADLAGKRAFVRPGHVLRAHADLAALDEFFHLFDIGERYANHDIHALALFDERLERGKKRFRFRFGVVHFPVACDDRLSHNVKSP